MLAAAYHCEDTIMKITRWFATSLFCLSAVVSADAPFIEHTTGFFASSMPLAECREQGKKAFTTLGITEKSSTNPRNEVVGFKGDYKVVLYCVSDEGGCDAPEEPYASGGTVIVAGAEYAKVKGLVDGVKAKLQLQ
jgi:hypothetical protein